MDTDVSKSDTRSLGDEQVADGSAVEQFCGHCGRGVHGDDRFCRGCGHRLSAEPDEADRAVTEALPHVDGPAWGEPSDDEDQPSRWRRRHWIVAAAVAGLLCAAAGVVLATGALSASHKTTAADKARAARLHLAAERHRLLPGFTQLMNRRDDFFASERRFQAAMSDANSKISSYQSQNADVQKQDQQINNATSAQQNACLNDSTGLTPCPNPTYPTSPTVPDLSRDVKQLRSAAKRLDSLHASLLSITPPPALKVLYAQLVQATSALNEDATYNADTITQAITMPQGNGDGDTGSMDDSKIKTLHPENALPAVQQMNRAALGVIGQLQLARSNYDVPGGHDLDPADHSSSE